MFVCRAGESDQRGGKFHLRVVSIWGGAAQGERLLDQGIAIEARGGILFLLRNTHPRLSDPLFVSFREIADVKPCQGIRVARGFRRRGASVKPREEFFCGNGISARVEGGAAKRFHANEDRGAWL